MDKKNKHITPNKQGSTDEQWLRYLHQEMSEEESHAFEMELLEDDFEWDAMEGLEQFSNKEELNQTISSIKQNILRGAQKKKKLRKRKKLFPEMKWNLLTLIILFFIIVCTMYIIHLLIK